MYEFGLQFSTDVSSPEGHLYAFHILLFFELVVALDSLRLAWMILVRPCVPDMVPQEVEFATPTHLMVLPPHENQFI